MKANNLADIATGYPDVNNQDKITLLQEELNKLIMAGDNLAQASHRLQSKYDGIHRLRKALSEWYKTRADEFGRGDSNRNE